MSISTIKKIEGFAHLEPGWHDGQGGSIPDNIIDLALNAHFLLRERDYVETNAFPSVAGGVQVCGYKDGKRITIEVREEADQRAQTSDAEVADDCLKKSV